MTDPAGLVALLREKHLTLALAESCTGGMISASITSVPGASEVFPGGIVSYANEVKESLLGVPHEVLMKHGAVSRECAEAMLEGACRVLHADCAIAVTGIAGPGGGTPEKPVGLVWIGAAVPGKKLLQENHFSGSRDKIREQTRTEALKLMTELLVEKNMK